MSHKKVARLIWVNHQNCAYMMSLILFQLNNFEMRYSGLQQEALQTQDKNRQSLQELSAKEEETVVIKVELSALQEKFKIKCNEVRIWIRSFSLQIRICTGLRNTVVIMRLAELLQIRVRTGLKST